MGCGIGGSVPAGPGLSDGSRGDPVDLSLKLCWGTDFSFFLVLSYLQTAEGHPGGRTDGFRTMKPTGQRGHAGYTSPEAHL